MENQQNQTSKVALNYGLYLGLAAVLLSVIIYAMGMQYEQDWKVSVISFIVMITFITLGIKKYKELNGGFLTLGQGLKTGIAIGLIAAVISIIYTLIFMNFIEPDSIEKGMEVARQKMLDNPNLSEEQIDQALEMQKKFSSPGILAAVILILNLFFGFIISLIASLIMQKKENEY